MEINDARTIEPEGERVATPRGQAARIYAASFVGTTIEFFDFIVYGTAAALVFPQVFFAGVPSAMGIVFSFATLAIGYAAGASSVVTTAIGTAANPCWSPRWPSWV
ncbi:hypothetical protein EEB14_12300 [Rhodococcus sp. WS4]|nr:hypothetical protein EEB14_12300 [Rhodococcus sp. WS4]